MILTLVWLKHALLAVFRREARRGRGRRREHIYVDASFKAASEPGEIGTGGIGVWVPRRGIAIALKVDAKTSMEAEILALLAGALAAKRFGVERPLIYSDCKSAVRTATQLMNLGRTRGLLRKLARLKELSAEHRAFRHVYDAMQGLGGTLEWQPREMNREADLASNIGSRYGNMGILLSGSKNRNHALNDVLSLSLSRDMERAGDRPRKGPIHRSYRCGTRTVALHRRPSTSRSFLRDARGLIARLSAEVA